MASYNKVIIMGNLTQDIELKYTQGGTAVAEVSLAINEYVKDGPDGVTFVPVRIWGKTAENCAKFLSKGSLLHVEGRLRQETWVDKDTQKNRSKLLVVAERVQFLGGKQTSSTPPSTQPAPKASADDLVASDDSVDDIPF